MQTLTSVLGIVGVISITIAYFLLNIKILTSDGWIYPFVNFIGASFIVCSLLYEWNLSAFLMEALWALISLFGWIKNLRKKTTP